MTGAFLPFLVVVPLVASAAAALIPRHALQAVLLIGSPAFTAVSAVLLLAAHATTPVIAVQIGGFPGGIAIALVSDTLSATMLLVTSSATLVALWFAIVVRETRLAYFPSLALMLTAGVNGALLTGDLFNLFVFVEVMLLPSYALLAMTGSWRRLGVGRLFILVNLLTSTILLVGIGLVYAAAGSVNLAALAGAGRDPRSALAVAVVMLALLIKAGAVPVHGWLPRAYPATSASVMGLFSALHTKVAIYALFRLYAVVFGGWNGWSTILVALAVLSMIVGSWSSLGENTIRRVLSFQMVAGVGYIIVGLGLASGPGSVAGLFYLVHHIVTMGGLILLSGAIEHTYGTGHLAPLSGLMRRDKGLAAFFAIGLMSLVGFPPGSGLIAKIVVVLASARADVEVAAVVIGAIVGSSILTLLAAQRLWRDVFWGPPLENAPQAARRTPGPRCRRSVVAPGAVLVTFSVALFLYAGPVMDVLTRSVRDLGDVTAYVQAVLP